jgi:hypothetical protein
MRQLCRLAYPGNYCQPIRAAGPPGLPNSSLLGVAVPVDSHLTSPIPSRIREHLAIARSTTRPTTCGRSHCQQIATRCIGASQSDLGKFTEFARLRITPMNRWAAPSLSRGSFTTSFPSLVSSLVMKTKRQTPVLTLVPQLADRRPSRAAHINLSALCAFLAHEREYLQYAGATRPMAAVTSGNLDLFAGLPEFFPRIAPRLPPESRPPRRGGQHHIETHPCCWRLASDSNVSTPHQYPNPTPPRNGLRYRAPQTPERRPRDAAFPCVFAIRSVSRGATKGENPLKARGKPRQLLKRQRRRRGGATGSRRGRVALVDSGANWPLQVYGWVKALPHRSAPGFRLVSALRTTRNTANTGGHRQGILFAQPCDTPSGECPRPLPFP